MRDDPNNGCEGDYLPACGGYNECGILEMHSDHKAEINKAKKEIKTLTKKLKDKKEEKESMALMKGQTKANFSV